MDEHKISDKVIDLLYEGVARLDYVSSEYDMETDQPQNASWITIDAEFATHCTDVQTVLEYASKEAMQVELLRLVERIFTPELLDYVRRGEISNLSLRIGPRTLRGEDLNEENDIELPDKNGSRTAAGSIDFGKIADLGTVDLGTVDYSNGGESS